MLKIELTKLLNADYLCSVVVVVEDKREKHFRIIAHLHKKEEEKEKRRMVQKLQ